MKTKHVELLQRLEQFQLDSPEAALPFSARLARENHWSPAFTQRVIAEYKRFAFLAVAAGHPVSPPEEVDQVWHLHLLYSRNYWQVFCPDVLGQPLHHQPTTGGREERGKFDAWYRQTLASYEAFFGETPPRDIWPAPEARAAEKHAFRHVDEERNWVIPKPRLDFWKRPGAVEQMSRLVTPPESETPAGTGAGVDARATRTARFTAFAALALLTLVGPGAMLAQGANPLDWRGPDFIKFYLVLLAVCFGGATWLRWKLRQPTEAPPGDLPELDPYAMAYLNGGRVLAVNAAIANLVNQNLLSVDPAHGQLTSTGKLSPEHPLLERAVHAAARVGGGQSVKAVREGVEPAVARIATELKQRGLVVADEAARKVVAFPLLIAALAPMIGGLKIQVGLQRDKPVEILVVLCIVSIVTLLIGFARRPLRSRWGDVVFADLKARHAELRQPGLNPTGLGPAEFAMLIGLFGLTALAGTEMEDLRKTLTPPSGDGGGCGSSCGGGGGGCGGGCGGCGGD